MSFFWTFWNTLQNGAAFSYHNCIDCYRLWNLELRDQGRPICWMNTHDAHKLLDMYPDVPEAWYNREEYTPISCPVRLQK